MKVATRVVGVGEMDARLRTLRTAVKNRILRRALRQAAQNDIRPAVIAKIPWRIVQPKVRRKAKSTGLQLGPLKRAFTARVLRPFGNGQVKAQVVSKSPRVDGFYARMLERGWLSGRRNAKRRNAVRRQIAAKPFAGPAAESAFPRATETMRRVIGTGIEAEMARGGGA